MKRATVNEGHNPLGAHSGRTEGTANLWQHVLAHPCILHSCQMLAMAAHNGSYKHLLPQSRCARRGRAVHPIQPTKQRRAKHNGQARKGCRYNKGITQAAIGPAAQAGRTCSSACALRGPRPGTNCSTSLRHATLAARFTSTPTCVCVMCVCGGEECDAMCDVV